MTNSYATTSASPANPDPAATSSWVDICAAESVMPDRGIAALVHGQPVAIFRLADHNGAPDEWFAISHIDPFSGAPVMARGLVGSLESSVLTVPTVASPLHKQRFNLRTGYCLDDESARIETFAVRVVEGRVQVQADFTLP